MPVSSSPEVPQLFPALARPLASERRNRSSSRPLLGSSKAADTLDARINSARAFVAEVLEVFWRERGRQHVGLRKLRSAPKDLTIGIRGESTSEEAIALGRRWASAPIADAAYEISSLYASMLPHSRRAEYGMYFTPPALTQRLLDLVTKSGFDWTTGRVIDPACGGGAFLAPIVERLIEQLQKIGTPARGIVESVRERVWGIEVDPFLAWISQVFVDLVLLEGVGALPRTLPSLVLTGDALSVEERTSIGHFDLIIGNPPYGRVRLTSKQRSEYAASLYGHANLYGLFTHFAVRRTAPRGIIAFVTPTSFLGGHYFKNLRRILVEHCPPVAVDFVTERSGVFRDVLQEACLSVFRRHSRRRRARVSFLQPLNGKGEYAVRCVGEFYCNGSPGAPWLLPRSRDQVRLIRHAANMRWRLSDYGYAVSTGPLVWNRHKDQLRRDPGSGRFPLVWAESIRSDGQFRFAYDRRHHAPYFECRPGQEYLITRTPCVLLQRTTAKEQARRLIAAAVPAEFLKQHNGMVVENHLNILRPISRSPCIPTETLAAILNSEVVDQLFRCISGSVAVSAYELESLPLPAPRDTVAITGMLRDGAARTRIEFAVAAAYGDAQ